MNFGTLLLLALGLAMDATAVAAARGLATRRLLPRHAFLVAAYFGGSQALMPCLGWWIGTRLGPLVEAWDHWIAFGLLFVLGAKLLWDAREGGSAEASDDPDLFRAHAMLLLAVATSMDALAVGVTLPMLDAPFWLSIATIGVTTAVLSVLGLFAGRRFGAVLGKRLDVAGGIVLIAIGTKILVEHLHAART